MKKSEYREESETMKAVMKYLTEIRPLSDEGEYVAYADIAAGIEKTLGLRKSRHAIAFAIERLCKLGKMAMYDKKLHILA